MYMKRRQNIGVKALFTEKCGMKSDRPRKYRIGSGKTERNPILQIQLTELNNNQNKR